MIAPGTRSPMFPLGTVLFPGEVLPLHVFEPRYRLMTQEVLAGDGTFGIILIARGSEVGGGDERVTVGTLARIVEAAPFPDGRYALLVRGEERFSVDRWERDDPYPAAIISARPTVPGSDRRDLVDAALGSVRRARALLSELGASVGQWDGRLEVEEATAAGWRLGALAPFGAFDRQMILEIDDPGERLAAITTLCDEIATDATAILAEGLTDEE